jgi:hypothetical protein
MATRPTIIGLEEPPSGGFSSGGTSWPTSEIGTSRYFAAMQDLVAIGA